MSCWQIITESSVTSDEEWYCVIGFTDIPNGDKIKIACGKDKNYAAQLVGLLALSKRIEVEQMD